MFKNVASQKIAVFAYDITTGGAKTGDAAQITVYVNKDWGGVNALADTSATELSSTNAPGWYTFDVSQSETNADALHFTGKSSTSNIQIGGQLVYTDPPNYTTFAIDSSGRGTANATQFAGQTITAAAGVTLPASVASPTNITAASGITVSALGANVITAASMAADAGAEIADAVLDRDMSTGTDSGSTTVRTLRQAAFVLRNKVSISAGTVTVYKADDSTTSWTAAATTDASANPITAIDPAGP